MRPPMIIVAIGAILAVAGSSIAAGSTAERRVAAEPAAYAAQELPKSLTKVQRAAAETARARVDAVPSSASTGPSPPWRGRSAA